MDLDSTVIVNRNNNQNNHNGVQRKLQYNCNITLQKIVYKNKNTRVANGASYYNRKRFTTITNSSVSIEGSGRRRQWLWWRGMVKRMKYAVVPLLNAADTTRGGDYSRAYFQHTHDGRRTRTFASRLCCCCRRLRVLTNEVVPVVYVLR